MYNLNDQAKLYLDRISAIGKSVATVLLIVIPLIILLLLKIQKNYPAIEDYISQKDSIFSSSKKIKEKKKLDSIQSRSYADTISVLNTKYSGSPNKVTLTTPSQIRYKYVIKTYRVKSRTLKKETKKYLDQKRKERRIQNDTVSARINALTIPIELPVLKETTNLSARTVVLAVMLILGILLTYLYYMKASVMALLEKFVSLKTAPPLRRLNIYHDIFITLPIWCLPLKNTVLGQTGYKICGLMGISSRQLNYFNITMSVLWLGILVLNILLAKFNWDIHYKMYHEPYSIFLASGLLLFALNLVLILSLLLSGFGTKNKQVITQVTDSKISRLKFISLSAAAIGCVIFEPVFNKFNDGLKWFSKPRFRKKNKNNTPQLQKNLYTNISKSKKRKHIVYYFSSDNNSDYNQALKTVPSPERFKGNLKAIPFDSEFEKTYLKNMQEKDLIEFIRSETMNDEKKLTVLDKYLEMSVQRDKKEISLTYIDLYASTFDKAKKKKHQKKPTENVNVRKKINEVIKNPTKFLPGKYSTDENQIKASDLSNFRKTKTELNKQLSSRVRNWNKKLKI